MLDLKQDQLISIEKEKYKIINKIIFKEKSSSWSEYKIINEKNGEIYYLNIELTGDATLFKIIKNKKINIGMNINFENEEFELNEKGTGKVETYFGLTDVALNDEVEYYEYTSKINKNKILSIEKWKDETEISIGKDIDLKNIKI